MAWLTKEQLQAVHAAAIRAELDRDVLFWGLGSWHRRRPGSRRPSSSSLISISSTVWGSSPIRFAPDLARERRAARAWAPRFPCVHERYAAGAAEHPAACVAPIGDRAAPPRRSRPRLRRWPRPRRPLRLLLRPPLSPLRRGSKMPADEPQRAPERVARRFPRLRSPRRGAPTRCSPSSRGTASSTPTARTSTSTSRPRSPRAGGTRRSTGSSS